MAPITSDHHHRSTTKASNKAFKTRHASKSALKERSKGKVESFERGARKTPQQQVMSKIDRRNHAKQLRQNKLGERREEGSVFAGRDGAPRIVAVVPLCADVLGEDVVKSLNDSVDAEDQTSEQAGSWRVEVPRFKQRVQYLTPARDLLASLDACRLADFVMFVLSAEQEVDELGEQMLRCIESQGVSTVLTGVHNLETVEPAKRRPDVLKSLKGFITHFFASQEKVHDLSSRQDCSNVMRSLCTTVPKGIRWREDRSWMFLDEVRWEEAGPVVTGTVRGRGLKADRLVQVGEWGDFQIDKIVAAPLESKAKRVKTDEMAVDAAEGEQVLAEPSEEQDDLAELAPEEAAMDDDMTMPAASLAPSERKAVMLDDHHYFHDDKDDFEVPKRVPKGTSKYQAAWYLDDMSDSGSDMEDIEDGPDGDLDFDGLSVAAGPADGHFEDMDMREPTEAGAPSEYPQSEMFPNAAPEEEAEQIAAYRKQRKDDAEDDREFPDEIELHPNVDARERLAKYRGLKSLRTSHWDTEEDKPYEPEEWSRMLEIADYKSAKNRVLKDTLTGGVKAGTRVDIHLRINAEQKEYLQSLPQPTALFSLLKHEHKHTSMNASINLSSDYPAPLKSKEQLILQCGPRRLLINPLFSQAGNTPNNVHKFDRYVHPGRTAVATFIGPVIWGSVPCLYFKRAAAQPAAAAADAIEDLAQSMQTDQPHQAAANSNKATAGLELIGTGTSLPPSTHRIVAKRIILTGHPYKIHKKLVTVRYMFFQNEDVEFYRALQLWTKRGRSGFIKETLGTHGYFKATFDGKVNPLDAVAVSLYKRVWPRRARAWRAGVVEEEVGEEEEEAPGLVGGGSAVE
ncbi:hypothetical protein LTR36_010708 [Oleoguttula mirabilis]|uniref:Bms1-type G domain-containing protein n=1 Tax=Oleoguttula mirabilis TaxID=1507867 RepID=A0AAV9JSL6_9PEZI|nr:hypothetical protein LTR36_010708 [Oleoguttula mirabilis]